MYPGSSSVTTDLSTTLSSCSARLTFFHLADPQLLSLAVDRTRLLDEHLIKSPNDSEKCRPSPSSGAPPGYLVETGLGEKIEHLGVRKGK